MLTQCRLIQARLSLVFVVAVLFAGCTFKFPLTSEVQPFEEKVLSGQGRDKVLLIDLSGVIMSDAGDSVLLKDKRPGLIARIREELDLARSDRNVKAVLLRINSPGGGVTASDTLYHELKKFKQETGVPIIAHIMDVGASGAYYAALAADAITAQPTSVTGSIGVILYRVDATALMQKAGVQAVEIASGERKGMGSPFRPMTDDERRLFKGIIDSLYGRFAALVATERKLDPDTVRKLADGRVFTSEDARANGLIDGIGYLDDAVELAKRKANLTQATLVTYSRPGDYRSNLYSLSLINVDLGGFSDAGASFLYLWWP